ncbi:ribonuclease H-like domain-containing protein [Tanacetum coccineum]
MSTSNTHQQSLADAGSETRPLMLEKGCYIPWASRFRRYLNQKRENRKWLNKAIDKGPYEFKEFTPSETEPPRMQKEEDLKENDLKHYEAEIEAMNLILISIPNDIYNSVDACTTAQAMWQRVERLIRGTIQNKIDKETRFNNEFDQFVNEPGEALVLTEDSYDDLFDYLQQFEKLVNAYRAKKLEKSNDHLALVAHTGDAVQNTSEDPLTSAMILLAHAITQRFSNPTNNCLRTSSNTKNQAIVQADRVQTQSMNSGNDGRNTRRSYVQEEVIEVRKVIMLVIVLSQEFEIQSTSWMFKDVKKKVLILNYNYNKVEVFVRTNKKTYVASKNVVSNKKIITDMDVENALKAKDELRALFTTSRTVKSKLEDTTHVVLKTRFSVKPTQTKSLDTTLVVSKTKIAAVTPLSAKIKVTSAFTLRDNSLSKYIKNKIRTSRMWQKWYELQPNVVWSPINTTLNVVNTRNTVVQIVLWIVDSGCSKHMTGLGHNLFSVGKFCDGDLKVAFRSNTCYVRNLKGDDLLTRARESNLYTISISDMAASSPVYLMSKATSTKSWLWHRKLSHLNFGTINDLTKHDLVDGLSKFKYGKDYLCSACERGKGKKPSHPPKVVPTESMNIPSKEDLDNLFGPMYEEYFKKRSSETSINSATQQVHNHEDSPSTSSIIVEEHEAPLVFGDSYKAPPEEIGKGVTGEGSAKKKGRTVAIIVEDMQKWRNDVKEITTLLLALLDEHQLRFSKYDNAKELWEAILKIFGGNETTKKTKKNQLKQKYGNFKAEGSEILEQTFNRLQAIVSHLEFIDVPVKQDDLNQKFLSSLAPEWLVYIMVWRNRDDLDTMSLDDVYNHLKVYEPEVQKCAGAQTASVQVSTATTDVAIASLSYDTVCAFIATQPNGSQIKYEDITQIDNDDIEEMDIKWNLALLSMRADRSPRSQDRGKKESYKKDPKVEEPAPKAMIAIDGIGWDWSYMAEEDENHALVADEEEVLTEYALMAKSNSSSDNEVYDDSFCSKSCKKNTKNLNNKVIKLNEELSDCKTDLYNYKRGLSQVEARLVEFKENEIKFCERIRVLERDIEIRDNKIENLRNELEEVKKEKESIDFKIENFDNASKDLDSLLGNQRLVIDKKGLGFNEYNTMPPPPA